MRLSNRPVKKGFRTRLMSPLGRYPGDNFFAGSAALIVSPEICFSINQVTKNDRGLSEVDSLNVFELPLLGSILLAGEGGTPYLYPYPTSFSLLLETDNVEEISEQAIAECRTSLLGEIQKQADDEYAGIRLHKPPALGGIKYELFPSKQDDGDRLKVFRHLATTSKVVLRGVNCLLKARMAFEHTELGEAACIYLWIALDAAHSLILQRLRDDGFANPSSKDAARYFEKISGGLYAHAEKFFEEDYENRIRAIHPDNRIGAEAIPTFLADDFYELNDMLIPLFYFLVCELPSGSVDQR